MRKLLFGLFGLFLALCFQISFAGNSTPEQKQVLQAGQQWANAVASRNPATIAALYSKNAFLYATFSKMFDNESEILAYFKNITKNPDLKVTFDRQNVRVYGNTAINSGLYTFSFTDNGKAVTVPARYTFVYTSTPKGWLIVDHHSSVLPLEDEVDVN